MPGDDDAPRELPRTWRVPIWQAALLLWIVCGCAALDIYASPSEALFIGAIAVAVVCAVAAYIAVRFLLVADDNGVWVRTIFHEEVVLWPDLRDVDVVDGRRGSMTLRVYRRDNTFVDVPPTVLLPGRPTKVARARAMIYEIGVQLERLAAERTA